MQKRIYEATVEAKILYGVELWGTGETWKEINKIRARFCKKVLGIPVNVSSEAAMFEMGLESSRGTILKRKIKYSKYIQKVKPNELMKICLLYQMKHVNKDNWAYKLKQMTKRRMSPM